MGVLSGQGMLIVWIDMDPAVQEEADRWYEQEHFPERITESGYLRARRYRALLGSPGYMGLLEAETVDALAGEGYKRVTANINEQSRRMRNAFRRIIRSPQTVLRSVGTIDGAVMLCARIAFAQDKDRSAFEQWGRAGFGPWVKRFPKVLGGHAFAGAPAIRQYMDSFRASGQQDETADCVLLFEFGRPEDAAEFAKHLSLEGLRALGLKPQESNVSSYQLMFDISKSHFARPAPTGANEEK